MRFSLKWGELGRRNVIGEPLKLGSATQNVLAWAVNRNFRVILIDACAILTPVMQSLILRSQGTSIRRREIERWDSMAILFASHSHPWRCSSATVLVRSGTQPATLKVQIEGSFSRREKSRKYVQYVSLPTPTAAPSKFPPIHLFFTSKQRQLHVLAEGTGMIASLLATMTVLHLEKRVLLLDF